MNILLLIPSNIGTIASVSYNLYKGLCQQDNTTVFVACLGPYTKDGFNFGNVFELGSIRTSILRCVKLYGFKKKNKIDISISTLLGATYWNVLSGIGEKKVGVFHTRLSQLKFRGVLYYWCNYIANMVLCSRLDTMIAVNKSAYLDLIKLHGSNKNIRLVYNIHDFSRINHLSQEDITDPNEKKIFESKVILYVGSLRCKIKGTDRLFYAFAKILKKYPGYKLVYIGSDEENAREYLQKLCNDYDLNDSVYFLGRKRNPYKYMKHAELLVSPSRDEGLPGVLIEALSLGLKCVASNSSIGVWEIMQCPDKYNPHLSRIIETDFGLICPNLLDNEAATINMMGEAIDICLSTRFNKIHSFDISRFSASSVIPHYLQ